MTREQSQGIEGALVPGAEATEHRGDEIASVDGNIIIESFE